MNRFVVRKWVIVFAMGLVLGLILLDETVIGLSLSALEKSFKITHSIITVPIIVTASTVAFFGRLSDFKGLKHCFFLGAILFTIGALGSYFSITALSLMGSRILQAFGVAFLFPTSIAIVTLSFPENKKGLSLGIYGSVGTFFPPISGLIAGFMLTHLKPQTIFLIPLPLLFLSSLLIQLFYTERAFHQTKSPLFSFDFSYFLIPFFSGSILVLFTAQFIKLGVVVFLAKALQEEFFLTPYETSLVFLPPLTLYPFITAIGGYFTDRFGPKKLMICALVITTALFLFFGITLHMKNHTLLMFPLVFWALATPFLFVSSMSGIMGSVPLEKRGEASGLGLTAQILGGAFGVSFLSLFESLKGSTSPLFLAATLIVFLVTLISIYLFKENT